jgi:flagellar hook assembly protein FlgD
VAVVVDGVQEPGYYAATWDGKDNMGADVASGVYYYRLEAGDYSSTRCMLLLK